VEVVLGAKTRKLRRETRSPDTAALLEDVAARGRFSARKETVRRRAFLLFGLIGPFRSHAGWN